MSLAGLRARLDAPLARRALSVALIAFVAWASLTPRPPSLEGLPSRSDLLVHLAMHAALAAAALRAWRRRDALTVALALAIGLELAQLGIEGRSFAWSDMGANLAGVAAAARLVGAGPGPGRRGGPQSRGVDDVSTSSS